MSVRLSVLAGLLPLLALGACGDGGRPLWMSEAPRTGPAPEAGYLTPPRVLAARDGPAGLAVAGSAVPGSRVRLGAPSGEAVFATTDPRGVWTTVLPVALTPRLYGVSMTVGERSVQSEGYLAVTPDGRVAQLRAGAGALVLSASSRRPVILAIDHDRDGAAMISGVGTADAEIGLRVDRTAAGASNVDRQGRFSFALSRPLPAGGHAFEISGEGGEDVVGGLISRPAPLGGPFQASRVDGAWRIDWMTPGGGAQTTLLFDPAGPGG